MGRVAVAARWRRSGGAAKGAHRGMDRYATSARRAETDRDLVSETESETETESELETETETETESETEAETAQSRRYSTSASARRAYSSRVE
jgi:hypothetical protein